MLLLTVEGLLEKDNVVGDAVDGGSAALKGHRSSCCC